MNISIRVIVPKHPIFDKEKWLSAVEDVMRSKTEPDLRALFRTTTEGWQDQPEFRADHFRDSSKVGVRVYTTHSVYGMVNAGSKSHLIRPRKQGGSLRFQPGYIPSTRPGSLNSRASSRSGDFITSGQVNHPGFEARKFDEQIAESYGKTFQEDIDKTFASGIF